MAILFDNPKGYKVLGEFQEKDCGKHFTYAENPDNKEGHFSYGFPHIIFVDDFGGYGYRYGSVLKTIAYLCTDEDQYGLPVVEKWNIKQSNFKV